MAHEILKGNDTLPYIQGFLVRCTIQAYLEQEQKVQLAQVIHQAIHPWPIHHYMERGSCRTKARAFAYVTLRYCHAVHNEAQVQP